MIEIFLRDRDIDYEMFVYENGIFKYVTKEKNAENKALYCGLNRGTIILDGVIIDKSDVTLDQREYIKGILNGLSSEVASYKKDYKPVYARYTSGKNISNMIMNSNVIEIPNREKFHEWIYINAYNYLDAFVSECEKKEKTYSIRKKFLSFLNKQ